MFCSECGCEAEGRFCWSCGAALKQKGQGGEHVVPCSVPTDWSDLVDYETLIKIPEVRELISDYASRAKKRMTGEQFLEHCDKIFSPLLGGVSTAGVAKVCQPLYAKLGVRSSRVQSATLFTPPGRVLVSVLCSLAQRNQQLTGATQIENGCRLEATVPSNMVSFAGELTVEVLRTEQGTAVNAAAVIQGQKFDWGKNQRCLEQLFADLRGVAQVA